MALALPFLLLLLFSYALTLDVDRIPTVILDSDKSPQSRELIQLFHGSRYFQIVGFADKYESIDPQIDSGKCLLAVVIPSGYSRDLLSVADAKVQILLDGSDSNTASIALGYAEGILSLYKFRLLSAACERKGQKRPVANAVQAHLRIWYNSELKSKNFIVPGLVAVIMMIITSLLTSLTIAREWEMGTMEQLLSTPLRSAELVLGKLTAFFSIGMIDTVIAIVTGVFIFDVPLRGSTFFVFATSCIFLFGALCMGMMISALTRQQLLAHQLGIISSFLPAFLLSGFIFSIENMPHVIQIVTYFVPARYFITILKGIFLKGVGLRILWMEVVLLILFACSVFMIATKKLKRKLV